MKLLRVLSSKDLDEVNEFLGELKDGDLYKERFKGLEDQKKEINALIEVYGKAEEIGRLNLKVRQLKEGVDKLVEDAQADRAAAKEEAEATKAASSEFVAGRNREANERFNEREKLVNDGEASLDRRDKALASALDDLASRETEAAKQLERAGEIRTKYREAVALLQKAIETTAKAL